MNDRLDRFESKLNELLDVVDRARPNLEYPHFMVLRVIGNALFTLSERAGKPPEQVPVEWGEFCAYLENGELWWPFEDAVAIAKSLRHNYGDVGDEDLAAALEEEGSNGLLRAWFVRDFLSIDGEYGASGEYPGAWMWHQNHVHGVNGYEAELAAWETEQRRHR